MSPTKFGAVLAAVLAIVWITLGFGALVLVALAAAIGALVGRAVEGRLDLGEILAAVRGRRSSS